jgi:hypothetical protein
VTPWSGSQKVLTYPVPSGLQIIEVAPLHIPEAGTHTAQPRPGAQTSGAQSLTVEKPPSPSQISSLVPLQRMVPRAHGIPASPPPVLDAVAAVLEDAVGVPPAEPPIPLAP